MRFAWGFDEEDWGCKRLKLETASEHYDAAVLRRFSVYGGLCPRGLWATEMVNSLRRYDDELQLFCVLPHEEQAAKWAPYFWERYFDMLEQCTHLTTVAAQKTPESQWNAYRTHY